MSLTRITAPPVSPLNLSEAKDHLRITGTDQDIYVQSLIDKATSYVDGPDGTLGRCLVPQTWEASFDCFPLKDYILIPMAPVISITQITYLDAAGDSQTLSSSIYTLSADTNNRPRVDLAYNQTWPTTRAVRDAVQVRFVAGYDSGNSPQDASAVPDRIKAGMLLVMGALNENAEDEIIGTSSSRLGFGSDALFEPYRRVW